MAALSGEGAFNSLQCTGLGQQLNSPTAGSNGSDGNLGTLGEAALPLGVFSQAGYAPARGDSGTPGFVGQGGGGGGGALGVENTCAVREEWAAAAWPVR